MMQLLVILFTLGGAALAAQAPAQPANRPLSPPGTASAQVLGTWVKPERQTFAMGGERYEGGRWIDITYGRPLLRGREAFTGTGDEYGKAAYGGAPVWRAGANLSTRLRTEVPLVVGGTTVAAGEYSVFIELNNPQQWTFIVTTWDAAPSLNANIPGALFGAFDYTPERDVLRTAMRVETLPYRVEQLTWMFLDMTDDSGRIAIMWDRSLGSVPFTVAR